MESDSDFRYRLKNAKNTAATATYKALETALLALEDIRFSRKWSFIIGKKPKCSIKKRTHKNGKFKKNNKKNIN